MLALALAACTFVTDEEWAARLAACGDTVAYEDRDGDGWGGARATDCSGAVAVVATPGDCADGDPSAYPGAPEAWYDGIDQDCVGDGDSDQDGDGHDAIEVGGDDCYDSRAEAIPALGGDCGPPTADPDPADVYPGAPDTVGDGVDSDCSGTTDFDADGDGFGACEDCDDADPAVHPGAVDAWYDGIDADCDGNDGDQDGDGYVAAAYAFAPGPGQAIGDCLDDPAVTPEVLDGFDAPAASEIHPSAAETWYDGLDQDCAGDDDFDQDGDGYASDSMPDGDGNVGTDCDDADGTISPGAFETWYDGVDQDCGGDSDYDQDGDGADSAPWGADCNDTTVAVGPGVPEDCTTADDDDCDGSTNSLDALGCSDWYIDADADGFGSSTSLCLCGALATYTATGPDDCDDGDSSVGDTRTWYEDADGDGYGGADPFAGGCTLPEGYSATADDCDDDRSDIHPGAVETCATPDDDDCDGEPNQADAEACTSFYGDADGDGYAGTAACYCEPTSEYPDYSPGDCNDTDATISPAASELCATVGVDDDCDGSTDEADAIDSAPWYRDADGDGYGMIADSTYACTLPEGYAGTYGDCDDGAASVSPAGTEDCATGADDNCDGATDEVDAAHCTIFYADADGDGYGTSDGTCRCQASGSYTSAYTTDCDDTTASVSPGAAETCANYVDDNCDGLSSPCELAGGRYLYEVGVYVYGEGEYDLAGSAVAGAGDVDGDGIDDLLVSAPAYDGVATGAGAVYLVAGPIREDRSLASSLLLVRGAGAGDALGSAVLGGLDIDGNGLPDLVVGAPGDDTTDTDAGRVHVIFDAERGDQPIDVSDARLAGGAAGDALGSALAAGDLDGDGVAELVVLGAGDDSGALDGGAVYAFAGALSGTYAVADASAWIVGSTEGEAASAIAVADLDGDGIDDLSVGTHADRGNGAHSGAVYVLAGPFSGERTLSAADAAWGGEGSDDEAGSALAAADLDGDGAPDLVVGAPGSDAYTTDAGSAYWLSSPFEGGDLARAGGILRGTSYTGKSGTSLAAGDLDGDGTDDLCVGAPGADDVNGDSGTVYAWFTAPAGVLYMSDAAATLYGAHSTEAAGMSLAMPGDVDADGWPELVVGAPGHDDAGTDAGVAHIVRYSGH